MEICKVASLPLPANEERVVMSDMGDGEEAGTGVWGMVFFLDFLGLLAEGFEEELEGPRF